MDLRELISGEEMLHWPENFVAAEDAIRPDLAGMQIFDAPIFGVAAADDPLFKTFQQPEVVGPSTLLPADWVPEARSVISFFLPFSECVRDTNRTSVCVPSDEWRHARIEGQMMLDQVGAFLCRQLAERGFAAAYPAADPRFQKGPYSSNWSERHVAYACGLGTFGLSRGLITAKGMAGRFGSVVTTAQLPVTERPYTDPFEYCIMCGQCQRNCPANAIDARKGVINGKDQDICGPFVQSTFLPPHGPNQRVRYGCGKCQVGVPCETGIPGKKRD